MIWRAAVALACVLVPVGAAQGQAAPPLVPATRVLSPAEALAADAVEYATRYGVTPEEAERRLAAQADTVAETDRIAATYRDRLAGIALEHRPAFRIVVLLTGDTPVPPYVIPAGGLTVPVIFRTGAAATRAQIAAAITRNQAAIRAALPHPPGLGIDQRTGDMVIVAAGSDVDAVGAPALEARFAALTGVPVHIRAIDRPALDMAATVEGGARVVGVNPADGRRYACTTGFVVTDGARTGVVTAAHCPDQLSYVSNGAPDIPLEFIGQWGWGFQDVQVHASPAALAPLFFADTAKTLARPVTGARPLASTRAGDVVCHRGERTGYSCAEVELTDFAPAGDLCGGACLPSWVTVAGPTCRGGDSGGPVFSGGQAIGIVKGGSYRGDGSCAFYFYMSTDYLPTGWSLMTAPVQPPVQPLPDPADQPSDRSSREEP